MPRREPQYKFRPVTNVTPPDVTTFLMYRHRKEDGTLEETPRHREVTAVHRRRASAENMRKFVRSNNYKEQRAQNSREPRLP